MTDRPPAPTTAPDEGRGRYRALAPRVPDGEVDLGTLVPGAGPLELEIGFGRGLFLLERARAAPAHRLVGVEVKHKLVYLVSQRLAREGLRNAVALAGDAREFLHRCIGSGVVSRFFLNFPDPWWKKRHHKRRVLGPGLLDDVCRLLVPGGELFVQTDVADRADAMRAELSARAELAVDPETPTNPYGARSNRERRATEDGLPIHRIVARRR